MSDTWEAVIELEGVAELETVLVAVGMMEAAAVAEGLAPLDTLADGELDGERFGSACARAPATSSERVTKARSTFILEVQACGFP